MLVTLNTDHADTDASLNTDHADTDASLNTDHADTDLCIRMMSLLCKSLPFCNGVLHPGLVQSHGPRFTALDVIGASFLNQQGTGVSTKQLNLYCQMINVGV